MVREGYGVSFLCLKVCLRASLIALFFSSCSSSIERRISLLVVFFTVRLCFGGEDDYTGGEDGYTVKDVNLGMDSDC